VPLYIEKLGLSWGLCAQIGAVDLTAALRSQGNVNRGSGSRQWCVARRTTTADYFC
jgi:hypothetical protein